MIAPRQIIFFTTLVVAVLTQNECDHNLNLQCTKTLSDSLSLGNPSPWNDPVSFRNQVEAFYQNSPEIGLKQVCKAFREFKTCLGSSYSLCLTPSLYVETGTPILQSYQYVSTFNTMHYTCGAGYQTYLSNQDCLKSTWATRETNEQLMACRFAYEAKSNAVVDQATVCGLGNTFLSCWENEFLTTCGTGSRDAQFWGCEYARVNIFTRFPQCNNKCVLPYNGGIIG